MVRPKLAPARLGATLYAPGNRRDLAALASGTLFPALRSMVICLEDSLSPGDLPVALENLAVLLKSRRTQRNPGPLLFVRPRSPAMLDQIMRCDGADTIDALVVPKLTAANLPAYLRAAGEAGPPLMPTLETVEAFDPMALRRLRRALERVRERIPLIRIGGADLHQLLGTRRSRARTVYDGPLASVIANLVATFAPAGFGLSAPLFEAIDQPELLREEVERDLEHGLMTKTAIHPSQIEVIQSAYGVGAAEAEAARRILRADGAAVFKADGAMCEKATHVAWARSVLDRHAHFGCREGRIRLVAER